MHHKKRIEIIIEAPAMNRLFSLLDKADVKGYSAFSGLAGKGGGGAWSREGLVSDAGRMVLVICIVDPVRVEEVLGQIFAFLESRIGIVTVSDVDVVRSDRF